MTGQIRWKLTFTYLIVIFIAMSILGLTLSYLVERQFRHEVRIALNAHAQLLRSRIEDSFHKNIKPGDLNGICRVLGGKIRARITVYGRDGAVLGDSENGLIEPEGSEVPKSVKELREGFGCRICHSEVREPSAITVTVPVMRGGRTVGSVKLSASLYEAKQAAARTRRIILATLVLISIIVAGVKSAEADYSRLPGYFRSDPAPAYRQPGLATVRRPVVLIIHKIAVYLILLTVLFKERAYGIMGGHIGQINHGGFNKVLVYAAAVALRGYVAFCLLQYL